MSDSCERELGDPDLWFTVSGYPDSLALCIIDAIYSTGARYATVENVVRRYRHYRAEQGGDADTDGAAQLLATIDELGGADPWASRIGNRRPTSTSANAPLKAEAVRQAAESLAALGIRTAEDLRAAIRGVGLEDAKQAWRRTPGQRSGITWDYTLMLAQVPGVKADRMVVNFVARAIGAVPARLTPGKAAALVHLVADARGWDTIRLDHAIWRRESGRPFQKISD